MGRPYRFKAEQVIEALEFTKGLVHLAAKRLGTNHQTIYNYIERYSTVKNAWEAASERMLDMSELKLFEHIMNGQPWAIAFHLKTKGKHRGYVEKTIVDATVEHKPITVVERQFKVETNGHVRSPDAL